MGSANSSSTIISCARVLSYGLPRAVQSYSKEVQFVEYHATMESRSVKFHVDIPNLG
jgi:hypothetical protein